MSVETQVQPHVEMGIPPDGDLARNLWLLIGRWQPRRIIETGTYIGTGSTAIIASAIDDLIAGGHGVHGSYKVLSIEAQSEYAKMARENLRRSGFDAFVEVMEGLSIPAACLPTPSEIKAWTVDGITDLPIEADHSERDRVYRYYAETAQWGGPDDRLREAMAAFFFHPDLILLDSAGHMGLEEFDYVMGLLRGPCFFVLDDIFHVKHYRSFQKMLSDERFDIRALGTERYGYAIARYEPEGER